MAADLETCSYVGSCRETDPAGLDKASRHLMTNDLGRYGPRRNRGRTLSSRAIAGHMRSLKVHLAAFKLHHIPRPIYLLLSGPISYLDLLRRSIPALNRATGGPVHSTGYTPSPIDFQNRLSHQLHEPHHRRSLRLTPPVNPYSSNLPNHTRHRCQEIGRTSLPSSASSSFKVVSHHVGLDVMVGRRCRWQTEEDAADDEKCGPGHRLARRHVEKEEGPPRLSYRRPRCSKQSGCRQE